MQFVAAQCTDSLVDKRATETINSGGMVSGSTTTKASLWCQASTKVQQCAVIRSDDFQGLRQKGRSLLNAGMKSPCFH